MKSILFSVFLLAIICMTGNIIAQRNNYPFGYCRTLDTNSIKALKLKLEKNNPDWVSVLKTYFSNIYDSSLPDLVCYIKNGSADIRLINNGEYVNELFGEKYVWVIIFSDHDLNKKQQSNSNCEENSESSKNITKMSPALDINLNGLFFNNDTTKYKISGSLNFPVKESKSIQIDSANIDLNIMAYEQEPSAYSIRSILSTLSTLIFNTGVNSTEVKQSVKDTTKNITFEKYRDDYDSFYVWIGKFKLGLNTKYRAVIRPPKAKGIKEFQYIDYNFGNYERSHFGISLGFGFTVPFKHTDSSILNDSNRVNLYAFGHYCFSRTTPPVSYTSWSAILGTNFLTGKSLNNIIIGIRYGFELPAGVIIGMNWATIKDKGRKLTLFMGFDYKF